MEGGEGREGEVKGRTRQQDKTWENRVEGKEGIGGGDVVGGNRRTMSYWGRKTGRTGMGGSGGGGTEKADG